VHDCKKGRKKAVIVAKNNACERLARDQRLRKKRRRFKLAKAIERRTRDLASVKCVKDEDGKVSAKILE